VSGDPLAWTAVSAVFKSSCGLVNSGQVKCWGENRSGELGNGTTSKQSSAVFVSSITTATSISAGGAQPCALLQDGTVKCWGNNSYGQVGNGTKNILPSTSPVQVSGITTASSIGVGGYGACALLTDSTIWCWGDNTSGQLGDGTLISKNSPVSVQSP